jgi:hypothetical protein
MRLCIVALLALAGGTASAADRDTLTLGGTGSAAQAATEDNELARGRYRGFYGWGGGFGYGYRGGFYGGFNTFYRPAYFNSFYYAPPVYSSFYVAPRPVFYTAPVYYYQPACAPVSFYLGIGGGAGTAAPAVNLGAPMQMPAQPGGLRYDGGPANPVPLPKPDAQPIPGADPLPISTKPAPTYRYKAYGEK